MPQLDLASSPQQMEGEDTDRFTVADADGLWDAIGADSDADLVEQAKLLTR